MLYTHVNRKEICEFCVSPKQIGLQLHHVVVLSIMNRQWQFQHLDISFSERINHFFPYDFYVSTMVFVAFGYENRNTDGHRMHVNQT